MGHGDPTLMPLVGLTAQGACKILGKQTKRKKPLSLVLVRQLVSYFLQLPGPSRLRNSAYVVLGFAGFLRHDELEHLTLGMVTVEPYRSLIRICLGKRKNNQLRTAREILLVASGNSVCPVKLYEELVESLPIYPPTTRVFQALECREKVWGFTGKPITYQAARKMLGGALSAKGEDKKSKGTHSMRSEGATAVAEAKISDRILQAHGGWATASARDRYIEEGFEDRKALSSTILT